MTLTADVIMPIRNAARFIVPALQSILAEPALGVLIIVDDGSTDDWQQVASPHLCGARTKIIRQSPSGIAAALNRGLAASTSVYAARMDADDISLPGRLSAQISWMDAHPHLAAAGTQVTTMSDDGTSAKRSAFPTTPGGLREELYTRGRCAIAHPSVILRRADVLAVGGYRESFTYAEDFDLWLRLSETGAVSNMDACLLHVRTHPHQVSRVHKVRQAFNRDLALLSARERAARRMDPATADIAALSYRELQSTTYHPVIRKLALAYEAIELLASGAHAPLPADAARVIPHLARDRYLGDARRIRYDLITRAGKDALRRGNLADAVTAYVTLARCRAHDSKYLRTT
ncbi:glycosyltransferase [Hyphomicrobium sp. DY-1]|uniref:glycosyltransferase n=1 Tax=Hyphomicrobium sp. DY-1 TaxID=3075650 RepID=UPI0039C15191